MRILSILAASLLIGLSSSLPGQISHEDQLRTATTDEVIAGINRYDGSAIREAGRRRDANFLPFLKERLANIPAGYDDKALRLALARFGDKQELQRIVCEIRGSSPRAAYDAWAKLAYVQGSFSIALIEPLLDKDDARGFFSRQQMRKYHRDFGKDEVLLPARDFALAVLPAAVPGGPQPNRPNSSGVDKQQLATAWKQWLRSHRDAISSLQPTGEGIDYKGKSCRITTGG